MELRLTAEGFDSLTRRLTRIAEGLDKRVDRALGQGAERMQAAVKDLTPIDTGFLREHIFALHPKMYEWTVETNTEYAMFVEYGTGQFGDPIVPHTSKESWVYYSEKLQHYVRTSGQPPAHMFTLGFEQTHKEVFEIVRAEIREIIQHD